MTYERNCPSCNKLLTYINERSFSYSIKQNKKCASCSAKSRVKPKEKYIRNCPICNKEIKYKFKYKLLLASKNNTKCSTCAITQCTKSELCLRDNDGNYIRYCSICNKELKYLTIKKLRRANKTKSLCRSCGKLGSNNPRFGKPPTENPGRGWSGWYKNWFFRSILELSYMINYLEKNSIQWEKGESKKYKIPYINLHGEKRNYFPDFIIDNKIVIECKPRQLLNDPLVQLKAIAARNFCSNINLKYELVSPKSLSLNEINSLYKSEQIKFTSKAETNFLKYLTKKYKSNNK